MKMNLFTLEDLSGILKVSETTIHELVMNGKIPHKRVEENIRFNPYDIEKWLINPSLNMDRDKYIKRYAKRLEQRASKGLKAVQEYDALTAKPWNPKKFYLNKVKNKKHGFKYYVRYLENGQLVPTAWCTQTNDYQEAIKFATLNREALLEGYYKRAVEKKPYFNFISVFKNYYAEKSPYLRKDEKWGRSINDKTRKIYHNFINSHFIPFLRKKRIKDIEQIDTPFLSQFQDYLLADKKKGKEIIPGIKPQSINRYIGQIGMIFQHLIQENKVKINPEKSLIKIIVKKEHVKTTGCYEITKLKGVFNRKWKNELSYLMSMIMYTTNMRNCEIERIRLKDIFEIGQCHFIHIPESKTDSGVRDVPLHPFVYRKLTAYAKKNNLTDYIFKSPKYQRVGNIRYKNACLEMAEYLGYTEDQIKAENIRFYSGRHFWKTLMRRGGLGSVIEETLMGYRTFDPKAQSSIEKTYIHDDKLDNQYKTENAKRIFEILDKWVFK